MGENKTMSNFVMADLENKGQIQCSQWPVYNGICVFNENSD